jgi:hypothetical protein
VGLVHVGGLIPRAATADTAAVLARLGDGEADAHTVEHDRGAGRDRRTWIGGGPGDGDGDDFPDRLHAGLGVEGDGGLDVPLPLATSADVLLGAVELALPPGVPVVQVIRTVFDSADLPVEVQDSVMAADRHEFRYEERMR